MALTLAAKPLADAVAGTDFIVAIVDPVMPTKVFSQVNYTPGTITLGAGNNFTAVAPFTINAANPKLPQLQALSAVADAAGQEVGYLKATLAYDAADTVNASSPATLTFSVNALAITANSSS